MAFRIIEICFFIAIFSIYFSSAVGLYNSTDSPQFFTTEALIKYQNPDMAPFSDDPQFFIGQDWFSLNNRILSYRGYLSSLISVPIHLISTPLQQAFTTNNFPSQIRVDNFKYKLSTTSLFVSFTLFGLIFYYQTTLKTTQSKWIAISSTLFLAIGTYFWKYSATLSRSGIIIMFLGLGGYLIIKIKDPAKLVLSFLLLSSLIFGIDIFLAVGFMVFTITYFIIFRRRVLYNKLLFASSLLIAVSIILFQLYFNYIWYGSLMSNQVVQRHRYLNTITNPRAGTIWFSTPLFPTIINVLFGFGPINPNAFSGIEKTSLELQEYSSLSYAKKYTFFGMFSISPFLLFWVFIGAKDIKINNTEKTLTLYTLLTSLFGLLLNTKFLIFWAGNQYDIRLFYPYCLPLSILTIIAIKKLLAKGSNIKKYIIHVTFLFTGTYSIFHGWLGELNMYWPAQLGERKVWVDIFSSKLILPTFSYRELINLTFMNRENVWIAVAISLISILVLNLSKKTIYNH